MSGNQQNQQNQQKSMMPGIAFPPQGGSYGNDVIPVDAAAWMVTGSSIYLVFMALVWTFFYKILFNNKSGIPWYGFGVVLIVLVTIAVLFGIAGVVMSSIQLSYSLDVAEKHKRPKKK